MKRQGNITVGFSFFRRKFIDVELCMGIYLSQLLDSTLVTAGKKTWKKGSSLLGKFCDFEGKIKKYIREICHSGGKFHPDCREINIFPGLTLAKFQNKYDSSAYHTCRHFTSLHFTSQDVTDTCILTEFDSSL